MSFLFFFKQKTAYEMRISDWSSDVCSSDLSSKAKASMSVKSLESWGAFQSISTPTLCGKAFPKDSIVRRLLEAIPRLDAHRAGLAGNARRGAQRNAVEQRHVMDLVEQVGDEELDVQPRAQ